MMYLREGVHIRVWNVKAFSFFSVQPSNTSLPSFKEVKLHSWFLRGVDLTGETLWQTTYKDLYR